MPNQKASSALVVAGAAVAASAAAAWFGSRRLRKAGASRDATRGDDSIEFDPGNGGMLEFDPSYDRLVERESAELPIGHSADPEIDGALSHTQPEDQTSGASLFGEPEDRPRKGRDDAAFDEIWSATPGFAEGEQTEGYDAVAPEDLGAVWLERATQTTHEQRPHPSDPNDIPNLEDLSVSEASRLSSLPPDELEEELAADDLDDDDELELPGEHRGEPR